MPLFRTSLAAAGFRCTHLGGNELHPAPVMRIARAYLVTGQAELRLSETMACIWSIVSDGSEVQLNGKLLASSSARQGWVSQSKCLTRARTAQNREKTAENASEMLKIAKSLFTKRCKS